jgi:hypothetical protein
MSSKWIAWGITCGQIILLLGCGVVLSEYWLMLPVWMRNSAGAGLGLAFAIVGFRFFKFQRKQKRLALKKIEPERESTKTS